MELSTELQMDMHRRMVRIRLFEEAAGKLAEAAKLPGFLHLYVGQEAVAAGVCAALDRRRPDHLDAPRARPSRRQGWPVQRDDGRTHGQVDRLLQGQGWLDAHLEPRRRHARRERHRRSRRTDRRRRRVRQQVQGQRQRGRPVLRRRLHQHRRLPRSRQHGVRAQAPGGVRVREQRVRRVHRPREDHGDHRHRRPCRRLRHAGRDRRRHGRGGHPRSGHRSRRPGPTGRWPVADRSEDVPLLQPPRHPEPRAQVPHRRRGRRVARARSDLHVRRTAHRDGHGDPRRHRRHLGRTASRHRHGDRVRREQPGTDTRPVARRRVHPRGTTAVPA